MLRLKNQSRYHPRVSIIKGNCRRKQTFERNGILWSKGSVIRNRFIPNQKFSIRSKVMPNNYISFEFYEAGSMVNKTWFMFPFARLFFLEFTGNTLYESWVNIVTKTKEMQRNYFLSFGNISLCKVNEKRMGIQAKPRWISFKTRLLEWYEK